MAVFFFYHNNVLNVQINRHFSLYKINIIFILYIIYMNSTKIQNNKFKDCPALMSDGRQFTDYRSNTIANSTLMSDLDINTSFDYRNRLTEDANAVILDNRDLAVDRNGCSSCDACTTTTVGQMCESFSIRDVIPKQYNSKDNKKINEFRIFTETNLTEAAARPGFRPPSVLF